MRTQWRCAAPCLLAAVVLVSGCSRDTKSEGPPAAAQSQATRAEAPRAGATDSTAAMCAVHRAPATLCFLCDPSRRDPGRLWCAEHARYEDRCWLCHPELRDAARLYCEEHGLYEDECFYCHPELAAPAAVPAPTDKSEAGLWCREHNVSESVCGICHPELAAALKPGAGLLVRFASREAASRAGIETSPPRVGAAAPGVECYAEIVFDQNRVAHVTAPVGGTTQSVEADLGDQVREGEVLATLRSSAVGDLVARAVLSQQAVGRERSLHASGVSAERDLQEAEAAYHAARVELKTFGFDDGQIEALVTSSVETSVLPLRAPFRGEIVERGAVRGALVEAGSSLFTVVDRSTMWAMLDVPEHRLAHARVGQRVELRLESLEETVTGTLTWIAPQVDDRTRMARARAEVPDPRGILRDHMFARARILTGRTDPAMIVPAGAVQSIQDRDFVFVKVEDDLYEARRVRLGDVLDGMITVDEGLGPQDLVVVAGSFIAKSQFMISKLGAGCVD